MPCLRFLPLSVAGLILAGCAPEAEVEQPTPPSEAAVSQPDGATDAMDGEGDDEALDATEILARDVCAAGDDGFGALLPDGHGFASRGPDARVHAAWNIGGEGGEAIVYTPGIDMEERTVFDTAVASFMRHNLVAGVDRDGITGAYRLRDGRFCVVQTEREVIEDLRDAVLTAQGVSVAN